MSKPTGIERAIDIAGNQRLLADRLGVKQQCVSHWKRHRVPADRIKAICDAVDGQVTPQELRPDIFGRDAAA